MKSIPHSTWSTILHVVWLGLGTNFALLTAALPLVVLLITTDPVRSWPLLALAAALAAPAITAAGTVFAAHRAGETQVIAVFLRGWRAAWRRSALLGGLGMLVLVVLLTDVRMLAGTAASVIVVPVLAVLVLIAAGTTLVGLVALAEAPTARLRDVLRAALLLGVRRWYLTALSLIVLAVQAGAFTAMPAVAIGLTAAPALYVAWANSRHTLLPVLETNDAVA